jgi:hypothetical protein
MVVNLAEARKKMNDQAENLSEGYNTQDMERYSRS